MHFPTNLRCAEDSLEYSHAYLTSCWEGIVFESWYGHVFCSVMSFVSPSWLSCWNMDTFFTTPISFACKKCLIGRRLIDRKSDKLLPRTLYRIFVAVHVFKMHYLDYCQSGEREREKKRARVWTHWQVYQPQRFRAEEEIITSQKLDNFD